ncbi:hypothetical protein [Wolbachia endosymbiont of Armadillidium arcangelii]|uniref:Uncharacterized protein n=1 Tax=Wolbachia endosymbiont of Armadillidium arcangelii TaxID=3158571 RepID=A0AAU7Q2R7_9RICK
MINESLSDPQLETFSAPSENEAYSPKDDMIATQVVNVSMPSSCDSAEGKNDKLAEMSINFCMPKKCLLGKDEKFVNDLKTRVKVGEEGYILRPDGTNTDLKLRECLSKLKILVPSKDITFLGGRLIATCKNEKCEQCLKAVNNALIPENNANPATSKMYEDFSSDIYDSNVI